MRSIRSYIRALYTCNIYALHTRYMRSIDTIGKELATRSSLSTLSLYATLDALSIHAIYALCERATYALYTTLDALYIDAVCALYSFLHTLSARSNLSLLSLSSQSFLRSLYTRCIRSSTTLYAHYMQRYMRSTYRVCLYSL